MSPRDTLLLAIRQDAGSSEGGRPALDGAKLAAWDTGEVGGFEAYLLAEEDKDGEGPEDTYRFEMCVYVCVLCPCRSDKFSDAPVPKSRFYLQGNVEMHYAPYL